MAPRDLRVRTRRFALAVVALWRRLPRSKEYLDIGDQLRRAADSVAANYRAARCGRSRAEFTAKLGVVLEEADESQHWLEELVAIGLQDEHVAALGQEASELVAIFTASVKTAKRRNAASKRRRGRR